MSLVQPPSAPTPGPVAAPAPTPAPVAAPVPPPLRRPSRRGVAAMLALVVAVVVSTLVAGALVVTHALRPGDGAPVTAAARAAGVQRVLDARADAVRRHDEAAWMATVHRSDLALVARQRAEFRGVVQVPLTSLRYTVVAGHEYDVARVRQRWGATAGVVAVLVRSAVRGYDTGAVAEPLALTFARFDGRWQLVGDRDADAYLPRGVGVSPWQVEGGSVAAGSHCLVVGDGSRSGLQRLAAHVDRAVAAVARTWPTGPRTWDGRVVVFASADDRVLDRWLDGDPQAARPYAVQVPVTSAFDWFDNARDPQLVGSRIVVDDAAADVDDEVLRHEITHAATRRQESAHRGAPTWLVEGIAEWTAQQPVTLADLAGSGALDDDGPALDAGTYRFALPASYSFYDGSQEAAVGHYTAATLACAYVAERWGTATLRRLHADLSRTYDPRDEPDSVDASLRRVLGEGAAAFDRDLARDVEDAWSDAG